MKSFEITECNKIIDISQRKEYKKLNLSQAQKIQISGFVEQLPMLVATETMSNAYVLHFPVGINGELIQYKNGGFGTPIVGTDGKMMTHASMEQLTTQAAIMQGLTIMAIVSSQYFLTEINQELKELNKSIDKILEFLYSEKKAELIAEVTFTKYAYENYSSIMLNNEQKMATIGSLQSARKIAMKDIEFYMSDLSDAVTDTSDLLTTVKKAFQIKNCLELSMQLHVMSNLLEIYYSQNFDDTYIGWIENNVVEYLAKCENRMLSCFSKLSASIHDYKNTPLKKLNKEELSENVEIVIDTLGTGKESDLRKQFRATLHSIQKDMEYYIDSEANVYLKTS